MSCHGFTFVRFAGSVKITEQDGIVGEIASFLEHWDKRRIQR